MRVCILENDRLPEGLAPAGVRFADYYVRMLREADTAIACDIFHTPAGEYPEDFSRYDAVLLTGSHADAFADEPWIVELRRRVSALIVSKAKLVGICFGHQVLGLCLGAPVGRAECGFTIGRVQYRWHGGEAPGFGLLASHQDQVKALPQGAELLASSEACPVAGFTYGGHVLSLQPHPELDEAIVANIVESRRETLGEQADAALASMHAPHEGAAIGAMIAAFIRGAKARKAA
jgi:GMP synthase-like glutamine amidotransferase